MRNPRQRINKSKIKPNSPCPCGSNKKYKKCCEFKPDDRKPEPADGEPGPAKEIKIKSPLTEKQKAILSMLENSR